MKKILLTLLFCLLATRGWCVTYCTDASIGMCYLLDESSGNIADSSGNLNIGVAQGVPTYSQTGKFGTAILINATDFRINDGASTTNLKVSLPISIVAWVNPANLSSTHDIWGNGGHINASDKVHGAFMFTNSSGDVVCGYGDDTSSSSTGYQIATTNSAISTGSYVHIACVIQGASNIQIYINGSSVSVTNSGTGGSIAYDSLTAGGSDPRVGGDNWGGANANATIDELAQFSRLLSSTEINNIMNNGLQSNETSGSVPQTVTFKGKTTKVFNGTTIY